MLRLLKYLKGYLRIKVWGFSPERFMNLCSNKNILLWDIRQEGEIYFMYISLKGFYQLRGIVRKTGTRVAILERYGLPFLIPKLLRRKTFLLGLIMAVAFWILSASFIWDIELTGNYQITEDMFASFLKENQVHVGMRSADLDISELEKQIRRTFPQVTWTSAKLTGTKLLIEIKENDAPIITLQEEDTGGSDLVAEYDGVIVSMIVRSGVPMVNIGDTVAKGDVLVDGKVPIYNEDATVREYTYVTADADIVLEHTMPFAASIPLDYIEKEYTGRTKKSHYLRVGDREMKLPEEAPFLVYDSVIKESRLLVLEKLSIPVFTGTYTHREYQNVEHIYSQEQAQELLCEKLTQFLATLEEKGIQIIDKDVKIDKNSGNWTLTAEFLVHEKTGCSVATAKPDGGEAEK